MRVRVFTAAALAAATLLATASDSLAQVGKRYEAEKREMVDPKTKAVFYALTTDKSGDNTIYHTHPMWTFDNKYFVYRGTRGGGGAFAINLQNGEIIQLTKGGSEFNLSRQEYKIWYLRGKDFYETNFASLLNSQTPLADVSTIERKVGSMPAGMNVAGGFGVDLDETCAYPGVGGSKNGVGRVDIKTGEFKLIQEVSFRMGHVQTNPFVAGEIIYCHETGGDAPQRIWFVKGDGTDNKAIYKEHEQDWVTHEIVVDKDHLCFNMMGHTPKLHVYPTGICIINIRTQDMRIVASSDGKGYWHSSATADLKWAAGDNVTTDCMDLINIATGEKIPVVSNIYQGKGISNSTHSHHRFSPDGSQLVFSSAMLGDANLFMVPVPPVFRKEAKATTK